jgi:tetratricopeptide (TPR) repeat protein
MIPNFHIPGRGIWVMLPIAICLAACSVQRKPQTQPTASINDLDSLHLVAQHNDSVDANLIFYEEAYGSYRQRFPGVDKPAFMAVAKGKDQAFCLFQPDPARTCLDVGNKFNDLGLKEPARDAYEAGLISEGANDGKLNILLWSSMAQLHYEAKEYDRAQTYLSRVLEVEPKNKWAKRLLGESAKRQSGG